MQNKQKVIIIFSVLILVIIVGLCVKKKYNFENFLNKSYLLPTSISSGSIVSTSTKEASRNVTLGYKKVDIEDWKTYKNTRFKFSMKYPPYMTVEELSGGDDFMFLNIGPLISGSQYQYDEHFPSISLAVADSKQKCDNVVGGIYGGVDGVTFKERELGTNRFLYGRRTQITVYGSFEALFYIQNGIPCKTLTIGLTPSPAKMFTEKGYTQIDLVDAMAALIKDN